MNCYESKIKNIKITLSFVSLTVVVYFFVTILFSNSLYYISAKYILAQFMGRLGLVVSGSITISYFLKLFQFRPAVIIDDTGIVDRRSIYGLIPWISIESVELIKTEDVEILEMNIKNPRNFFKRKGLFYCLNYLSFSYYLDSSKISIIFNDLNPGLDKVWEYIQNNYPSKIIKSG